MSEPNRTALVSGASVGLGRAFAERLAADGFALALVDLDDSAEAAERIAAAGGSATSYRCDVSDPGAVASLGTEVEADHGRVDVLVNNAGIYPYQTWDQIEFEDWRRVMSVNLDSMFLMTKAFAPAMTEAGWGRIVNIVSGSCFLPVPLMAHYIAGKMGAIGLTRALATEISGRGVTVNAVAPSVVRTHGTVGALSEETFAQLASMQSIKRVEEPADLVGTVSFLASEDAAFITAQTLCVDGGWARL